MYPGALPRATPSPHDSSRVFFHPFRSRADNSSANAFMSCVMTEAFRPADLSFPSEPSILSFPPSRPASASTSRLSGAKSAPCLRRESKSHRTPSFPPSKLAQTTEDTDLGVAEIQSIMQHTLGLQTPPTTFLGISPPRRQSGAANPLNQGSEWQLDAYLSSRSNLQALREIDARGVSFLKGSGPPESPNAAASSVGSAVKRPAEDLAADSPTVQRNRYASSGCTRVGVGKPLMSQIGFNIA